jgi:hypothetical protein
MSDVKSVGANVFFAAENDRVDLDLSDSISIEGKLRIVII